MTQHVINAGLLLAMVFVTLDDVRAQAVPNVAHDVWSNGQQNSPGPDEILLASADATVAGGSVDVLPFVATMFQTSASFDAYTESCRRVVASNPAVLPQLFAATASSGNASLGVAAGVVAAVNEGSVTVPALVATDAYGAFATFLATEHDFVEVPVTDVMSGLFALLAQWPVAVEKEQFALLAARHPRLFVEWLTGADGGLIQALSAGSVSTLRDEVIAELSASGVYRRNTVLAISVSAHANEATFAMIRSALETALSLSSVGSYVENGVVETSRDWLELDALAQLVPVIDDVPRLSAIVIGNDPAFAALTNSSSGQRLRAQAFQRLGVHGAVAAAQAGADAVIQEAYSAYAGQIAPDGQMAFAPYLSLVRDYNYVLKAARNAGADVSALVVRLEDSVYGN